MTELNKDGLIPGQPVDFATLKRIENSRKSQKQEPETKPKVSREQKGKDTPAKAEREDRGEEQ